MLVSQEDISVFNEQFNRVFQEIKCPICLNLLQTPRIGPCLHNFCEECIYEYIKDHHSECPTCRQPGVNKRSLHKNLTLNNLMEPLTKIYELWQQNVRSGGTAVAGLPSQKPAHSDEVDVKHRRDDDAGQAAPTPARRRGRQAQRPQGAAGQGRKPRRGGKAAAKQDNQEIGENRGEAVADNDIQQAIHEPEHKDMQDTSASLTPMPKRPFARRAGAQVMNVDAAKSKCTEGESTSDLGKEEGQPHHVVNDADSGVIQLQVKEQVSEGRAKKRPHSDGCAQEQVCDSDGESSVQEDVHMIQRSPCARHDNAHAGDHDVHVDDEPRAQRGGKGDKECEVGSIEKIKMRHVEGESKDLDSMTHNPRTGRQDDDHEVSHSKALTIQGMESRTLALGGTRSRGTSRDAEACNGIVHGQTRDVEACNGTVHGQMRGRQEDRRESHGMVHGQREGIQDENEGCGHVPPRDRREVGGQEQEQVCSSMAHVRNENSGERQQVCDSMAYDGWQGGQAQQVYDSIADDRLEDAQGTRHEACRSQMKNDTSQKEADLCHAGGMTACAESMYVVDFGSTSLCLPSLSMSMKESESALGFGDEECASQVNASTMHGLLAARMDKGGGIGERRGSNSSTTTRGSVEADHIRGSSTHMARNSSKNAHTHLSRTCLGGRVEQKKRGERGQGEGRECSVACGNGEDELVVTPMMLREEEDKASAVKTVGAGDVVNSRKRRQREWDWSETAPQTEHSANDFDDSHLSTHAAPAHHHPQSNAESDSHSPKGMPSPRRLTLEDDDAPSRVTLRLSASLGSTASVTAAPVVTITGFEGHERDEIARMASRLGAVVKNAWDRTVTHVVCHTGDKGSASKRTLKYCYGLLSGAHLVPKQWLASCAESGCMHTPHEVNGCTFPKVTRCNGTSQRTNRNSHHPLPDVYARQRHALGGDNALLSPAKIDGKKFFVLGAQTMSGFASKAELVMLLELAGAVVREGPPRVDEVRDAIIVGYDAGCRERIAAWRQAGAEVVTHLYVMDSITEFAPARLSEYAV